MPMTILRATYGKDGKLSFVPFNYTPRPVTAGAELEEDFAIYGELTEKCLLLPPTSTMLLFCGDLGMTLFLRRAETPEDWKAFKGAFLFRYPCFEARYAKISCALRELIVPPKNGRRRQLSFPQVLFGGALLATLPTSVRLNVEAPLPFVKDRSRCDFELASKDGRQIRRSEIFGMVSRIHGPVTEHGCHYIQRQPQRLNRYAAAGLAPPLVVYADDLWDTSRLRRLVYEARDGLDSLES